MLCRRHCGSRLHRRTVGADLPADPPLAAATAAAAAAFREELKAEGNQRHEERLLERPRVGIRDVPQREQLRAQLGERRLECLLEQLRAQLQRQIVGPQLVRAS